MFVRGAAPTLSLRNPTEREYLCWANPGTLTNDSNHLERECQFPVRDHKIGRLRKHILAKSLTRLGQGLSKPATGVGIGAIFQWRVRVQPFRRGTPYTLFKARLRLPPSYRGLRQRIFSRPMRRGPSSAYAAVRCPPKRCTCCHAVRYGTNDITSSSCSHPGRPTRET